MSQTGGVTGIVSERKETVIGILERRRRGGGGGGGEGGEEEEEEE